MEYEAITNFYLAFKKKSILGNKKIRVRGPKIRVGRVKEKRTSFFLGLINLAVSGSG